MRAIEQHLPRAFKVAVALSLLGVSLSAAPAKSPTINLLWNTSIASDSLLRYGTSYPVLADAPQVSQAAQVTVHQIPLDGPTPGTFYYFVVRSCSRRGCTTASGIFDTFPSCPDLVPPVSGSWQKVASPNVSTAISNELLGVAAISENDVWAVGWSQDPTGPPFVKLTPIERFNGGAWSIVPSPNHPNDTQSVPDISRRLTGRRGTR